MDELEKMKTGDVDIDDEEDDDDSSDDDEDDEANASTINDTNDNTQETNANTVRPHDLSGWSEYEINRAKKVERNNARLRELGLMSLKEEIESNAKAWKTQTILSEIKKTPAPKRSLGQMSEGARKSSRSRSSNDKEEKKNNNSLSPQTKPSWQIDMINIASNNPPIQAEYQSNWKENSAQDTNSKDNPTLMYEHCLMRIRSMTHNQLKNRIRVIENAAGRQCILKLAMTLCCLQDEGLWDLAALATESLERVKKLQHVVLPSSWKPKTGA